MAKITPTTNVICLYQGKQTKARLSVISNYMYMILCSAKCEHCERMLRSLYLHLQHTTKSLRKSSIHIQDLILNSELIKDIITVVRINISFVRWPWNIIEVSKLLLRGGGIQELLIKGWKWKDEFSSSILNIKYLYVAYTTSRHRLSIKVVKHCT